MKSGRIQRKTPLSRKSPLSALPLPPGLPREHAEVRVSVQRASVGAGWRAVIAADTFPFSLSREERAVTVLHADRDEAIRLAWAAWQETCGVAEPEGGGEA